MNRLKKALFAAAEEEPKPMPSPAADSETSVGPDTEGGSFLSDTPPRMECPVPPTQDEMLAFLQPSDEPTKPFSTSSAVKPSSPGSAPTPPLSPPPALPSIAAEGRGEKEAKKSPAPSPAGVSKRDRRATTQGISGGMLGGPVNSKQGTEVPAARPAAMEQELSALRLLLEASTRQLKKADEVQAEMRTRLEHSEKQQSEMRLMLQQLYLMSSQQQIKLETVQ